MRTVRQVRTTVNLPNLPRDSRVWVDWPPNEYITRMLAATYLILESAIVTVDDDNRVMEAQE